MRNVVDDRPEIAEALQARLGEIVTPRETGRRPPSLAVWSRIETSIQNLYQGESAAALELLTPILDQDPSIPLVYELIGRGWLEEGEVAKAQGVFLLALERGIETGLIRRDLGKIYLDSSDLNPSDLDRGDLDPGDQARNDLTPIDLIAAESNLRGAVELNELDARARLYLAEALRRLGRHGEATSLFRQAIEINNTYLAAWTGLAQTLLDSGQLREALAAYRRALDIDPGNPTISAAIDQINESSQPPPPHSDR
jgi:tetratricopeptide (TPR) repeat protein